MSDFFFHLCLFTGVLGILAAMVALFTSSGWMLALAAGLTAVSCASMLIFRYLVRQEIENNGQE